MDNPNYYELLDVEPDCSMEELVEAYHRALQWWAPLKDTSLKAQEMMRLIAIAYQTLKDPDKRREYDKALAEQSEAPGEGPPAGVGSRRRAKDKRPAYRRPRPWRPLYVIGGIVVLFLFVFSCGAVLFAVTRGDVPEDPTPVPRPRNADEYVFRGIDFADQGDFQQAILDFTEAIRLDPRLARAYHNRGITYNKLKRYQDAIQDFTTTVALNPEHGAAYANRAFSYVNLGMDDEAETDFRRAVELGVNEAELRQRLEGARLSRDVGTP